jgi:hypothetical protein
MTEQLREIITAYLVVNGSEPVIFSSDESKIDNIVTVATKKNIRLKKRKITSNRERVLEIGKNFFERKTPKEAYDDPVKFRNKLIVEWHETISRLSDTIKVDGQLSWGKVCKKYNIEECTAEQFSTWMLDINEFIKS